MPGQQDRQSKGSVKQMVLRYLRRSTLSSLSNRGNQGRLVDPSLDAVGGNGGKRGLKRPTSLPTQSSSTRSTGNSKHMDSANTITTNSTGRIDEGFHQTQPALPKIKTELDRPSDLHSDQLVRTGTYMSNIEDIIRPRLLD